MGLDQYLYAKKYIPRWDHSSPEERATANEALEGAGMLGFQIENAGVSVQATAMYWRKSNQIHGWFIDNVQNGSDDGGEHYVDLSQLVELRDLVQKVLNIVQVRPGKVVAGQHVGPATNGQWEDILEDGAQIVNVDEIAAILPTASGFFFGSTDYDSFYLQDLGRTLDGLNRIIDQDTSGVDFYYYASW